MEESFSAAKVGIFFEKQKKTGVFGGLPLEIVNQCKGPLYLIGLPVNDNRPRP